MSVQAITWAIEQDIGAPAQKLILICLANYADKDGVCWPGQKALAEDASMTERSVRTHIKALEASGLISRQERRRADQTRTSDQYTLNIHRKIFPDDGGPTGKSASDLPEKNTQPHRKSFPGNEPVREPSEEPCVRESVKNTDLEAIENTYPSAGLVNANPQALLIPIQKAALRLGGAGALVATMAAYAQAVEREKTKPVSLRRFLDPSEGFLDRYARKSTPSDSADVWRTRIRHFHTAGRWADGVGPKPGQPGCLAPAEIQREFGYDPQPTEARGAA